MDVIAIKDPQFNLVFNAILFLLHQFQLKRSSKDLGSASQRVTNLAKFSIKPGT